MCIYRSGHQPQQKSDPETKLPMGSKEASLGPAKYDSTNTHSLKFRVLGCTNFTDKTLILPLGGYASPVLCCTNFTDKTLILPLGGYASPFLGCTNFTDKTLILPLGGYASLSVVSYF
jgi:hypothetical protein